MKAIYKYLSKNNNNNDDVYKINIFEINVDFRRRILGRVTVVLEKESWGIRISLNTTKSVQVFNEILLISSCYILKNTTRIFFF